MDALATTVLRRMRRVHLPAVASVAPPDGEAWVRLFETDLAERGWVLDAAARRRLSLLDPSERDRWADWLLASADQSVGAHRVHMPLFRNFPDTPGDPDRLYIERVLALWFQDLDVCVLCGEPGGIGLVDPCGHLVCGRCFDAADYAACPICGRPSPGRAVIDLSTPRPAGPALRSTVVSLGTDLAADATSARDRLVARAAALSEADRDDLRVLVDATSPVDISWLPDVVPSRETTALVAAWALAQRCCSATGRG